MPNNPPEPLQKHFLIHYGRYEDLSLAFLYVTHEKGFKTGEDAVHSFYDVMLECWHERGQGEKDCCVEAPLDANFCPTCGVTRDRETRDMAELDGVYGLFMGLFGKAGDGLRGGTNNSEARLARRFATHGWVLATGGLPEKATRISGFDRWLHEEYDDRQLVFDEVGV